MIRCECQGAGWCGLAMFHLESGKRWGVCAVLLIVGAVGFHPQACRAADPQQLSLPSNTGEKEPFEALPFQIKLETILKHDDRKFLWFHPRVAAIPQKKSGEASTVIMMLQKHLTVSDHYAGLNVMRSTDLGRTWTQPDPRPELDWQKESKDVTAGISGVTPGWHAATGKLLAIGIKTRYGKEGQHLYDKPRSHEGAYAVYDPRTGEWTPWRYLQMPDTDNKFYMVMPDCAQWVIKPDGSILLPVAFKGQTGSQYSTTVLHCSFDGKTMKYIRHGSELTVPTGRGCYEPSLAFFRGLYFLTLRADDKAYIATSRDGLKYDPIQPWVFDDSKELGSYNTQQHWLTHSDGLFLSYTRRGANNDHVERHRAPLFIAQVNPQTLQVVRSTEKVLIPERGATLGNFGASAISADQSWVTVAEGIWNDAARKRGAEGAVFFARVIWSKPNKLIEK